MRQSKKEKTNVDLSTPLNLDNFKPNDDDCFGRLWNPSDSECTKCADIDVCGCIYSRTILPNLQKKAKTIRKKNYLDEVNFDRIDKDKLYNSIVMGKTTSAELATYVKHYSKCEDTESIKNWIKLFKDERNLVFIKGVIHNE